MKMKMSLPVEDSMICGDAVLPDPERGQTMNNFASLAYASTGASEPIRLNGIRCRVPMP